MRGLGSGDNGEWLFMDFVGIISLLIGLQNLDLNINQEDMDKQTKEINKTVADRTEKALAEIHAHLQTQDKKIDEILNVLRSK